MVEISTCCPHCGRENELATAVRADAPTPSDGAVSLCWGCGNLAVFMVVADGVALRLPTERESAAFDRDPFITKAQAVWRKLERR